MVCLGVFSLAADMRQQRAHHQDQDHQQDRQPGAHHPDQIPDRLHVLDQFGMLEIVLFLNLAEPGYLVLKPVDRQRLVLDRHAHLALAGLHAGDVLA